MTTLNEDVNDSIEMDATDMFLSRWQDADEKLSDDTDEGKNAKDTGNSDENDETDLDLLDEIEREDAPDEDESDTDQNNDADQDADDKKSNLEASDDHLVTITVDGEAQTVPVKDLKRLYGQEASLTRKSQEVAAARKVADAEGERYVVAAQKMLTRAEERFQPFENIDWMVAQNKLTSDEFTALREEARSAYTDLQFLKSETDDVLTQVQTERSAQMAEAAKEAITELERDIPGWNREVYDKVRSFAVDTGMTAEMVNSIIDPAPLKILHMAMKYSDLKAKASQKKKTSPKAAPKKVVSPSSNNANKLGQTGSKRAAAMSNLQKTGRTEDAVSAFMGGWADKSDD